MYQHACGLPVRAAAGGGCAYRGGGLGPGCRALPRGHVQGLVRRPGAPDGPGRAGRGSPRRDAPPRPRQRLRPRVRGDRQVPTAPARPRAGHRCLAQPRSPGGVHGVRRSAARGSRDGGRVQPALATPLARSARTALLPQPLILFGHAALHHEGSRRQPARCGAEGAAG